MGVTAIEWTDRTWNPVVGCEKVSAGCKNCYAKQLHDQRHKAYHEGKKVPEQYAKPFETVQLMPDRLGDPLSWRKPQRVFVNSVSDLFHEAVPDEFLLRAFDAMRRCTWAGGQNEGRTGGTGHTFQVLTKRPERMREFMSRLRWTGEQLVLDKAVSGQLHEMMKQIWLGTSVENQAAADARVPHLLAAPAAVRFLSCEPLLGPVDLVRFLPNTFTGFPRGPRIDWVIVGGESGPDARPMAVEWARSLVAQCQAASVPVFVKQLGQNVRAVEPRHADWPAHVGFAAGDFPPAAQVIGLKDRKGGDIEEWPADLRVREFPEAA